MLRSPQSGDGEAPHRLRLSTHVLPERDRFEIFRENFWKYVYRAEVESRSEGPFEGSIELLKAGNVGISRIASPPSNCVRTRRHLSDSDDALTLFVGINPGLAIKQAGISHEFRPGDGFLYHGSIPGASEAVSPVGLWGIKVPAARVLSGLGRGRDLKPMQFPSELPAMKLVTQYLNSFATVASSRDPDVREAFGTHLVDLMMLLVGADRSRLPHSVRRYADRRARSRRAAKDSAFLRAPLAHVLRKISSPDRCALTGSDMQLDERDSRLSPSGGRFFVVNETIQIMQNSHYRFPMREIHK
jgi:hypothetical protein